MIDLLRRGKTGKFASHITKYYAPFGALIYYQAIQPVVQSNRVEHNSVLFNLAMSNKKPFVDHEKIVKRMEYAPYPP